MYLGNNYFYTKAKRFTPHNTFPPFRLGHHQVVTLIIDYKLISGLQS